MRVATLTSLLVAALLGVQGPLCTLACGGLAAPEQIAQQGPPCHGEGVETVPGGDGDCASCGDHDAQLELVASAGQGTVHPPLALLSFSLAQSKAIAVEGSGWRPGHPASRPPPQSLYRVQSSLLL